MIHFKKQKLLGAIVALIAGGSLVGPGTAWAQEAEVTEGAEVLTRGPVHEAFAGTVSFDPEAGIIVDREPPPLIEEIPPEQELEGENVTWIPGYWAWEEDQSEFLWISGIWRDLPPGREWVPGYWAETEGNHQWTSGYWEDEETTEVTYLPEPPKSVEAGPNVEAASNDQTWVPGNWVYREDRYAWRPGTWVAARENWVWTPAYYRWTHRGYVYVDGYWDYPVARRGVVFAPVRFRQEYVSRPNYSYTPATVIALSVFTNHLFVRPRYGHYYFGDYYEPRYRDRGYFASHSYNSGRRGWDPIYSHQRWENRNDRDWERSRRDYFEFRRDHEDARPPRTWAALSSRAQGDRERGDFGVADRYDRFVSSRKDGGQKFKKIDKSDRDRYVVKQKEIRKYSKEREQLETKRVEKDKDAKVSKVKINRSPVSAKKSAKSDKDGGPPPRLQPRISDKEDSAEVAKKGEKAEKAMKTDRDDSTGKTKKNQDEAARTDEPKAAKKGEVEPEKRVKPGQKRESEPASDSKDKPATKRDADPTPKGPGKQDDKRKVDPTSEPKEKKPQSVNPDSAKKVKKAEQTVAPKPEKKVKQPAQTVAPKPEKKVKQPAQTVAPKPEKKEKRPAQNATPTSEKKVKKAEQSAAPKPEKKRTVENRDYASTASPKVKKVSAPKVSQPKPEKKVVRSEPKQAARKMAEAQPKKQKTEAVRAEKARSSSGSETVKKEENAEKPKKKKSE